jgi:hypothetical protein
MPRKAVQVLGGVQVRLMPPAQPMLGGDQIDDRVIIGEVRIALEVVVDAGRLTDLEAIVQIDGDQLHQRLVTQLPRWWQEGVEVGQRGLLPGVLEALDKVGKDIRGRGRGVGRCLIGWAHGKLLDVAFRTGRV